MPVVTGVIRRDDGAAALGFVVRAFDQDLRSEQALGETAIRETSGRYLIRYSDSIYQRAEKKSADLIVRVFDQRGRLRAESAIVFNARQEERIDLTVGPPTPERAPSELEGLQEAIEPVREGVAYRDLDDRDLRFLTEEIFRVAPTETLERRTIRERLGFLSVAARLGHETAVPLDAFYGWFRQQLPQTLAELLTVPLERLRRALILAIDAAIIPDITGRLDEIIDRIAALRLGSGRLVPRHVTVQLIAGSTSDGARPLAAVDVAVVDLEADDGDPALGNTTTDRDGIALIGFMMPADAAGDAARRLELTIREGGATRAVVVVAVPSNLDRVLVVRVPLLPEPASQISVAGLTGEELTRRLHDQGIDTLDDLLSNPDVVDEIDPDGVERLRGIARWTALAPDVDSTRRAVLIDNGILSASDLAARSRADVMRRLAPGFGGDAETYAMFKANRDTRQVLQHHLNGVWLSNVTTPGDDDDPEIPDGLDELIDASQACGCEDCLTAVSPAAYLAQLLDWVLTHVKDADDDIEFAELENDLHQPFGRLPASCRAVEEEVRQVRLVVESLWSLTGLQSRTDFQLPTPFRLAYRSLRNEIYRQILVNFGVSFQQLRTAVLTVSEESPDAERIAAERAAVAGRLGVDEAHLNALFFNVEAPPTSPAEDDLERLFGYKNTRAQNPLALPARAELVEWQRERLEQLWEEQDWSLDGYQGDARLPFVDPEIINPEYFRTPLEANAAFELLSARAAGLAAHRASMQAFAPLENGLDALVEEVLGASIAELRVLSATLHDMTSSEAQIVAAHDSIDALHMTQAGFSQLMEVDARLQSGEPLGESDADVTAALTVVFDTLSRARRQALFPEWVAEEQSLALVFGPKLFWMPVTAAQLPNPWQADPRDRAAWEEALARRSRRPLIEPDQITLNHITVFKAVQPPIVPALTAVQLWEARRGFVDERLEALIAAEEGQPNFEARLQAVLQASTLGINLDSLRAFAELETNGIDLGPHLARIGLTLREYLFLAEIRARTAAGAAVGADDRSETRAILVQAEKRREYAEWRLEEQSADVALTLHPDRFSIPETSPAAAAPQTRWLHDPQDYESWVATLAARTEQFRTLESSVAHAVSEAEESVLPGLRNILIMEANAEGDSLAERAAWLDRRLLIDMAMSGCHMTTRVSQAIETLQRLVRGVYAESHITPLQHLTLDAVEDYENEWGTIGDYRDWRATMLMYLFPENSLQMIPMLQESEAFRELKSALPRDAGPDQACEAAHHFSAYFRDVSTLKTAAACQALARMPDDCEGGTSQFRVLTFVFARSRETGHVYVAAFLPGHPKDLLFQWSRVQPAGEVEQIAGAAPHTTPGGKRYIVLFVVAEHAGERTLEYLRFDLNDLVWSKRRPLDLPHGITRGFRVAPIQKRPSAYAAGLDDFSPGSDCPTIVAVEDSNDILYVRRLDSDALAWETAGWMPLYGKRLVSAAFFDDPFKLAGVVQRNDEEYLVIIEKFGGGVFYRTLFLDAPGRDDLRWRRIEDLDSYRGALGMPLSQRIAVLSNQGAFMRYRTVLAAGNLDGREVYSPWEGFDADINDQVETTNIVSRLLGRDAELIEFIADFDEKWLQTRAGVSLDDIDLNGTEVPLFIPVEATAGGENWNPLAPFDTGVQQSEFNTTYVLKGSLLDVLTMKRNDFHHNISASARYRDKSYYQVQVINAAMNAFAAKMKTLSTTGYLDALGDWKLADRNIDNLSLASNDGLVKLVWRLARNRISSHLSYLQEWIAVNVPGSEDLIGINPQSYESVALQYRAGSELGGFQSILGNWHLAHLSGDGSFPRGPSATQAVVLAQERATYITRLINHNQQFVYDGAYPFARIVPNNDGPYDVAPQRSKHDMALRRVEIKTLYERDGSAMAKAPMSVRTLLKEAFNLVPIFLGCQLQRSGYYDEALGYFRLVFDERQTASEQRIDFGLELERSLPLDYDRADEFLRDTTNAHTIAATRNNSYTRQIVLLIVRCLIDHADALFTNDTAADNARARELYARAIELLGLGLLRPGHSSCANIIGELEVELVESGALPIQQFMLALDGISDPVRLRTIADSLRAANTEPSTTARLGEIRRLIVTALEEEPPPRTLAQIRERARATTRTMENLSLAHGPTRARSQSIMQHRRRVELGRLAEATNIAEPEIVAIDLPWLRQRRPQPPRQDTLNLVLVATPVEPPRPPVVERMRAEAPLAALQGLHLAAFVPATGVSFQFCIPQNPVIQALRRRAEANLFKLRTCRNIAGFVRPVDPYGAPIGIGAGMVSTDGRIFSGVIDAPPTIYRFAALIARAKELVTFAQQIEAGYQTALERAEQEALSILQAEQNVELTQARVTLQDLRITQAHTEMGLVRLQRSSAVLREQTFGGWIAAGKNEHERALLNAYRDAGKWQRAANEARTVGQVAGLTLEAMGNVAQAKGPIGKILMAVTQGALQATQIGAAIAEGVVTGRAIDADVRAEVASFEAGFERQKDEWHLQQGLAALDVAVADQQALVAQSQIDIVQQERVIAGLEYTHASDVLRFLTNKNFTEEMYRWIAAVLEDIYRFFLQEASSIARLAERQAAFERQEAPLGVIQSNYWTIATPANVLSGSGTGDRLGLTGSARLLRDIYQVDGYFFETRKRLQALRFTLNLAELYPLEFQRFRETGVLVFETPLSMIDRQMPGSYACLIRQVSVSVVALINPTYGIRASLTSAGISRAVVGGDTFQVVAIRNLPERIALTAATTSSSIIELERDAQSLLEPFEGSGFDTLWELRMPKDANPWDFRTMATVLFTVEVTALHSFDYEREVVSRRSRTESVTRAFDVRLDFPDAFYDLRNPDLTATPMTVRFATRREDFPPNLARLRIQHVTLYFMRRHGESFEQDVSHLLFQSEGSEGGLGGPASSVDGRISTRGGNGAAWLPMIGRSPVGEWELSFDDPPSGETRARDRFAREEIESVLVVLTVSGELVS